MKKIRVSELPACTDTKGVVVLGVNSLQQSVKVSLDPITTRAAENKRRIDAVMTPDDKLAASTLNGKIPTACMPDSLPDNLEMQLFNKMWLAMLGDSADNESYQYPNCGQYELDGSVWVYKYPQKWGLIRNGYFPEQNASYPYWINGCKLSFSMACRVLFSRWHPLLKGSLPGDARTHAPMFIYRGDDEGPSGFNLDMASCIGGSMLLSVDLVGRGANMQYNSNPFTDDENSERTLKIYPQSAYRAFQNNIGLFAVNGEIDMRLFSGNSACKGMFNNCRNLRVLRLGGIPDSVTQLDFTGCTSLWPHLFYQMTFFNSVTQKEQWSRTSTADPLIIKIDPQLWSDYRNGGSAWSFWYESVTFTDWLTWIRNKRIQLVSSETGNPLTE